LSAKVRIGRKRGLEGEVSTKLGIRSERRQEKQGPGKRGAKKSEDYN
jgi:hypothetical protein